jgi:glyoxylase-like metal-dependent hydrolase (beta-lactamase superfamily II)
MSPTPLWPLPVDITPLGYLGFPGGVGKTWEPGAFEQLLGDVTGRVFDAYGDDTVVYPGHGDDTTLGAERPHLAQWRERGW